MKVARWVAEKEGTEWHYCPACDELHPIPEKGYLRAGTVDMPTFSPPSFGQSTSTNRYCHYSIIDGIITWWSGSWHARTGQEPLPHIPDVLLCEEDGKNWVSTDAVFDRLKGVSK